MSEKVHDITSEDLPTLEPTTRVKVKRAVAAIGMIAAALLLINKSPPQAPAEEAVLMTKALTDPP